MNRLFLFPFVLSISFAISSCGNEAGEANVQPVAEPVVPYEITVEQSVDSIFKDRHVAVEGYLRLPYSMFVFSRTPLELYSRPNQREGRFLNVELSHAGGDESGVFKLPSNYSQSDLKVLTEDGDTLMGTERVRLTGNIEWRQKGEGEKGFQVVLVVDSVFRGKQVPPPYPQMKTVLLDSALAIDSTKQHTFVHAEGKLIIPSMIFAFKEYWLFLEGQHGKIGAHFVTGTGPNCLAPIPEKYKESDFKVYGADGKLLDLSKPVRVIGNFSGPDSLTTGDISVEHIEQVQTP